MKISKIPIGSVIEVYIDLDKPVGDWVFFTKEEIDFSPARSVRAYATIIQKRSLCYDGVRLTTIEWPSAYVREGDEFEVINEEKS